MAKSITKSLVKGMEQMNQLQFMVLFSLLFIRLLTVWKVSSHRMLPKPVKDSKFHPNLRQISLSSTTGKLFEKVIIKIAKRHIGTKGLLNAGQFGFRARHSTTLQCMRLTDHVTLNFSKSTAAIFLDIEKAFDTTWHNGLLYMLSKMDLSASLIKLISSFLSNIMKSGFHKVPSNV
jgi:hypothetical protein